MTTVFFLYVLAAVLFLLILGIVCVKKTQVFTGIKSLLPKPKIQGVSKLNQVHTPDGRKNKYQEKLKDKAFSQQAINRRGRRNK